jgi:hypothetical protein
MALQRERFLAYVQSADDTVTAHSVTIHHVDMTRAEVENIRQGLTSSAGLNFATCQVWAALTRMGLYSGPYERFRDQDLLGLEDDGAETVDPTQPVTPPDSA